MLSLNHGVNIIEKGYKKTVCPDGKYFHQNKLFFIFTLIIFSEHNYFLRKSHITPVWTAFHDTQRLLLEAYASGGSSFFLMTAMTSTSMLTTCMSFPVAVLVMRTLHIRIIIQCFINKSFHRFICISGNSSKQLNACCR